MLQDRPTRQAHPTQLRAAAEQQTLHVVPCYCAHTLFQCHEALVVSQPPTAVHARPMSCLMSSARTPIWPACCSSLLLPPAAAAAASTPTCSPIQAALASCVLRSCRRMRVAATAEVAAAAWVEPCGTCTQPIHAKQADDAVVSTCLLPLTTCPCTCPWPCSAQPHMRTHTRDAPACLQAHTRARRHALRRTHTCQHTHCTHRPSTHLHLQHAFLNGAAGHVAPHIHRTRLAQPVHTVLQQQRRARRLRQQQHTMSSVTLKAQQRLQLQQHASLHFTHTAQHKGSARMCSCLQTMNPHVCVCVALCLCPAVW